MQLKDFDTLDSAKAYLAPVERMISHDMIISLLTQNNCITSLQTSADEKARGFYLAVLSGVREFNLMNSHPVGQAQQALLTHLVNVKAANQDFADACIAYANSTRRPFKGSTKHDFEVAKGVVNRVEITPSNGFLTINTTKDCEEHNPQIYIKVGDTFVRKAGFRNVESKGQYVAEVPRNFTSFWVDNSYGAVS